MTEQTLFNPCSRKGEVRAQIATELLNAMKSGDLSAIIARSADFYGPKARTSIPNNLVFDKFAKGTKAACLINDLSKHSFTFTPDAAKSLVLLAEAEKSWNQTWHLPTAPNPPTGREFIEMAAKEFGLPPKYRILGRPMIMMGGWIDTAIRELKEMLYQYDSDYVFDSSKFGNAFDFEPTSYPAGIRMTARP